MESTEADDVIINKQHMAEKNRGRSQCCSERRQLVRGDASSKKRNHHVGSFALGAELAQAVSFFFVRY